MKYDSTLYLESCIRRIEKSVSEYRIKATMSLFKDFIIEPFSIRIGDNKIFFTAKIEQDNDSNSKNYKNIYVEINEKCEVRLLSDYIRSYDWLNINIDFNHTKAVVKKSCGTDEDIKGLYCMDFYYFNSNGFQFSYFDEKSFYEVSRYVEPQIDIDDGTMRHYGILPDYYYIDEDVNNDMSYIDFFANINSLLKNIDENKVMKKCLSFREGYVKEDDQFSLKIK